MSYPHTNEFGRKYHAVTGDEWRVPYQIAIVDLTLDESELWRHVRKSYRQLIKWGRESLDWCIGLSLRPMQKFHAEVAGRVTKPQESWDLLQGEIDAGRGDAIYGSLDGRLVSAALFIDGGGTTVYWSGVYDRSLFPKPLAHYGIWLAILRAKARGQKVLELGAMMDGDKKHRDISMFKRGFATGYVHDMQHD